MVFRGDFLKIRRSSYNKSSNLLAALKGVVCAFSNFLISLASAFLMLGFW